MAAPKRIGIALAGLSVLLLGSGAYLRVRANGNARGAAITDSVGAHHTGLRTAHAFSTNVAIPVEGASVRRDTLVLSVTAAGEAAAWRRATLLARVGGRVLRVRVRENDPVSAGSLVVGIDPAEYQLAVDEAEAHVADAEATYRELTLFDDRIGDPAVRAERERVARAKSGLDAARVALRRARLDRSRARVTAPFAGRVASIKVVPGQWVRVGDELATIVSLSRIKLEAHVLESEVGFLAPGRSVRASFAAFPERTFAGRVETINPEIEPTTRMARVTASLPNPDGRILPGMYARVALEARRFADRILVPRSAVLERDRRALLFVYQGNADGGLAKWRYVTTGLQSDSLVEIVPNPDTEMVEPGEVVLTDGHHSLVHDARVRLVNGTPRRETPR